jgi:hypothetical protein
MAGDTFGENAPTADVTMNTMHDGHDGQAREFMVLIVWWP